MCIQSDAASNSSEYPGCWLRSSSSSANSLGGKRMKWITRYAAVLMFLLFVILGAAVAVKALPQLVIPLLVALVLIAGIAVLGRISR